MVATKKRRKRPNSKGAESLFDFDDESDTGGVSEETLFQRMNQVLTAQQKRYVSAIVVGTILLGLVGMIIGKSFENNKFSKDLTGLTRSMHDCDVKLQSYFADTFKLQYYEAVHNTTHINMTYALTSDPIEHFDTFKKEYQKNRKEHAKLSKIRSEYRHYRDGYLNAYTVYTDTSKQYDDRAVAATNHLHRSKQLMRAIESIVAEEEFWVHLFAVCAMVGALCMFIFGTRFWFRALEAMHRIDAARRIREALIDGIGVSTIVVDSFHHIVGLNRTARDVFGYEESEVVGKNLSCILKTSNLSATIVPAHTGGLTATKLDSIFSSSSSDKSRQKHTNQTNNTSSGITAQRRSSKVHDQSSIQANSPLDWSGRRRLEVKTGERCEGRTKNGKTLLFRVQATTIQEVDGTPRTMIVCQDITELISKVHELDNQKSVLTEFSQRLQAKYTPCAHVLDRIQGLKKEDDVKMIRNELVALDDDISHCLGGLEEADNIIATRLDMFAVYTGTYKTEPHVQEIRLDSFLNSFAESAQTRAPRAVVISAEMPAEYRGLNVQARMDNHLFGHIATNLLSNARRNTSKGRIILKFIEEKSGMLFFSVEDEGHGIPDHLVSRLFLSSDAPLNGTVTGMGLKSCRRFARVINGDVWLEKTHVANNTNNKKEGLPRNQKKNGSEFRYCLPGRIVINTEKLDDDDKLSGKAKDPKQDRRKSLDLTLNDLLQELHVIIVEDSLPIRKSIIAKLSGACRRLEGKWTFEEHETCESLLAKEDSAFISRRDCLITVDQNLDSKGGVLTGTDLIERLVRANFQGVIVSASSDAQTLDVHLNKGAHIGWGKPLPGVEKVLKSLRLAFSVQKKRASLDSCASAAPPTSADAAAPTPIHSHRSTAIN